MDNDNSPNKQMFIFANNIWRLAVALYYCLVEDIVSSAVILVRTDDISC